MRRVCPLIPLPRDFSPAGRRNKQRAPGPIGASTHIYRFKLPKIPRTIARPTEVATERAALFIAASITVSR